MALIPLEEAQAAVLGLCPLLPSGERPLAEALGLVVAATLTAGEAIPPFDNTAMDGYAVRAADTAGAPVVLEVAGELAAGSAPGVEVGPGQAVRIMTGAPMPRGADAVVMVERTAARDGGAAVEVQVAVAPGTAVRRAGEDLGPGDVVARVGTVVGPAHLGVLASLGVDRVPVVRRARVGVLSTGDELAGGPARLRPGQIRDANRPALLALVRQAGAEAVDLGVVPDDEGALTDAINAATRGCDALVTSGGVSVGDHDHVKAVLDRLGRVRWMQVAIKPAKPLAAGVVAGTPVLGLPGNPVSSLVSFELFARPALLQMMGHRRLHRPSVLATATEDLARRPDGKVHFLRAVATADRRGRWRVRSAGGQGSHQLAAMAGANALAVVPDGEGIATGGEVETVLLSAWHPDGVP